MHNPHQSHIHYTGVKYAKEGKDVFEDELDLCREGGIGKEHRT